MALDDGRDRLDGQRPECPDPGLLAEYADDVLTSQERATVEQHLVGCADCRAVLADTVAFVRQERAVARPASSRVLPFRRRWVVVTGGLAAAAAVALAVRVLPPGWIPGTSSPVMRPELQELVAALDGEAARAIEGRLAGGFAYAPRPSAERGSGLEASPEVRIAAARLDQIARRDPSAVSQAALGVAYLALGDTERAVLQLERAVADEPANAFFQNDLAAAHLARYAATNRAEFLAQALNAVEATLALQPELPEAFFNKALIHEALGQREEAAAAWRAFLAVDGDSPWAGEARARLAALPARPTSSWESDASTFIAAAADNDDQRLIALVRRYPQEVREHLEGQLAPPEGGDVMAAVQWFAALERPAEALFDVTQDAMPVDTLAQLRACMMSPAAQECLDGIRLFAQGRQLYRATRYGEARQPLERACAVLTQHGIAIRGWCAFYIAQIDFRDVGPTGRRLGANGATRPSAEEQFIRIAREFETGRYPVLSARAESLYAGMRAIAGDRERSHDLYRKSLSTFRRIGETGSASVIQYLLLDNLREMGRPREAWHEAVAALRLSSDVSRRERHSILVEVVLTCLRYDLPYAAISIATAALENAKAWGAEFAISEMLAHRARAFSRIGRAAEANRDISESYEWLLEVPDPSVANRQRAEVLAAQAEVDRASEPTQSIRTVSDALTYFEDQAYEVRAAGLYSARGHALAQVGDAAKAERDFRAGMAVLEHQSNLLRQRIFRVSLFDDGWSTYYGLIDLKASTQNDGDAAWGLAERLRSQLFAQVATSPLSSTPDTPAPDALRRLLAPGTAVISYVSLPDRLLAWTIRHDGSAMHALDISSAELRQLVTRYRTAIDRGSAQEALRLAGDLHGRVFEPLRDRLVGADSLVVIPDGLAGAIPLAGLYDAGRRRFVVEDYAISTAPSATVLLGNSPGSSALGTTLVFGADAVSADWGLPPLPEIAAEAADIRELVPDARVILGSQATKAAFLQEAPKHRVIHFAGHAIASREFPASSQLLTFGAAPDSPDVIRGSDVMRLRLTDSRLVVLAACGTSDGPQGTADGVRSLASLFLGAGARSVVGVLWNANDRASRSFFRQFYSELMKTGSVTRSVQSAQLSLLRGQEPSLRDPRAWAGFVTTTRLLN